MQEKLLSDTIGCEKILSNEFIKTLIGLISEVECHNIQAENKAHPFHGQINYILALHAPKLNSKS